ncbi:hypothetical protein [Escherichia coli]|uniref:hypothetical protein n=1 Tax=Escherichia coli TaxID=562 RepID=UPI0037DD7F20
MNSRVGPMISTVTIYQYRHQTQSHARRFSSATLLCLTVILDIGWYFKAYLDSGDYGMGTLTSPISPW